jgi:hypothetical protein
MVLTSVERLVGMMVELLVE